MNAQALHILQTCLSPSWGGLEMQAIEVAKGMRDRGHTVWVASPAGSATAQAADDAGLHSLLLSSGKYPVIGSIHKTRELLSTAGIDIIHCHVSGDLRTVVPAIKLLNRPVPIVLSKRIGSGINKKGILHRLLYANVSKVFAISGFVHRNVLETTPVTADRVVTIHDAVDTAKFSLNRVDRYAVRREFGIPDDHTLIGFVGRFSPGKGHEEFLAAAHDLRRECAAVRFLVVGEASHGEGAYAESIRRLSTSLGLDDIVTFAGYRSDIPEIMAAFDIFAFPSHAESFGVALIEAMAMERPVVATRKDGIVDIVVDEETGLLITPKSASELRDALARLIADPALRAKLGAAGRVRVESHFSQRVQMEKMERIYFELIPGAIRK